MNFRKEILVLSGLLLAGFAAPAQDLVLENARAKLVFSGGKDYAFKSFIMEGTEVLPGGGSTTHPWQMVFQGPGGENPDISPQFTFYKGGRLEQMDGVTTAIFTWEVMLGGSTGWPVQVSVSLQDESELPEWKISADLPQNWVVSYLEFPRICISRPDDAKGILPVSYGTEYSLGPAGQIQNTYPSGTGTMQLVIMHHNAGTMYFAATDKRGSSKLLRLKGNGSTAVFTQEVTASWEWSENGHFELPWATVMAFTKDNWQEAVLRWYRPFSFDCEWGAKTIKERKIAQWVRDTDLWLRPLHVRESTMDAVRKSIEYFGSGVGLHWYYWHKYDFDTNYPDYFPAKDGFEAMVKESQDLQAHVVPYTNGRLWDPSNSTYKDLNGSAASCRKADGTMYTEVYASKALNTVSCPSTDIWQSVIKDFNKRILGELKTDGVYMDQIGCAAAKPCYAGDHPHAKGGGEWWPQSYRKLLSEMRKSLYKKGQAMTTEENAECYMDLFDMMLVVNSAHNSYTKMVPLFPLIYSDRCIYCGYTYIPWQMNNGSLDFISMKSLLWGAQLGWVDPEALLKYPSQMAFIKNLSEFRKGQHDLFVGGRFMGEFSPGGDNPTRAIPNYEITPVVMGAKWLSTEGISAYVLVNMDSTERSVCLPNGTDCIVPARSAIRIDFQ